MGDSLHLGPALHSWSWFSFVSQTFGENGMHDDGWLAGGSGYEVEAWGSRLSGRKGVHTLLYIRMPTPTGITNAMES